MPPDGERRHDVPCLVQQDARRHTERQTWPVARREPYRIRRLTRQNGWRQPEEAENKEAGTAKPVGDSISHATETLGPRNSARVRRAPRLVAAWGRAHENLHVRQVRERDLVRRPGRRRGGRHGSPSRHRHPLYESDDDALDARRWRDYVVGP